MPEPHEQLDEAMRQRRLELRMNWREVAQAAGISYEALRAIRRGDYRPTELTARGIDEALQWVPGGVYIALDGGTPVRLGDASPRAAASPHPPALSPDEETLRLVVRAVARELRLQSDEVQQVMRQVGRDLDRGQPREAPAETSPERRAAEPAGEQAPLVARTDLSDLLRERRHELKLSLEGVASRTADRDSGERLIEAEWLERLEQATLGADEYPEYPQLDALAEILELHPGQLQEAAGVQFMEVHTVWSDDGQSSALVIGELDEEGVKSVHRLMHLYGPARDTPEGQK
ncbi:helix-turn-helix domain-containing protein [Streptomyces phaeochromogenes]